MNKPITLGIIIARGGSKGVERKNIKKLRGKPLLVYTINDAKNSILLDRIILSTEDKEIAEIGKKNDVEVIMRPKEYAVDTAPMEIALQHVVGELEKQGVVINTIVTLYGCVPIRKKGIIDKVINEMHQTKATSVQTYSPATKPPQMACRIVDGKPSMLEEKYNEIFRRQQLEPAYYADGAVIAYDYKTLMRNKTYDQKACLGNDTRAIIQSPEDTVDINEPFDMLWAEFIMERIER